MAHINLGKRLFMNFDRADFVFVVEGQKIPGHKALLAETLPYFEKLLYGGLMESTSKEIPIRETSAKVFKEVMRYIYLGHLEIKEWTIEDLLALLALAHEYQFDKLVSQVVNALRCQRLDFDTWKLVKMAASTYNLKALKSISRTFTEEKLRDFLRYRNLEQFTAEFICYMFDNLKISAVHQNQLLGVICKWKKTKSTTEVLAVLKKISWKEVSSETTAIIVNEYFSMVKNVHDCQFWCQLDKVIDKPMECAPGFENILLMNGKEIELAFPKYQCLVSFWLISEFPCSKIQFSFEKDCSVFEIPLKTIEWESSEYYIIYEAYGININRDKAAMVVSQPTADNGAFKYSATFSEVTAVYYIDIYSLYFNHIPEIRLQNFVIS